MFKLFNDVRRVLLPKVEEADSHNLSFEWKCQDYKDVLFIFNIYLTAIDCYTYKRILKAKKDY